MRFGLRGVEIADPKPLDGVAAAVVKGRASGGGSEGSGQRAGGTGHRTYTVLTRLRKE